MDKFDELTASEALYAFAGWLTSRKEVTMLSAHHDAAAAAELVTTFCEHNRLQDPREGWQDKVIYPSE